MRIHCLVLTLLFGASSAAAQVTGPVAPALTAEQITLSESLAPKFDESAAREKARLETFANRPLGAVIQRSFNVFSNYLVMSAEMMPESSYGFRPTPEVRTFGEQINHATELALFVLQSGGASAGSAKAGCARSRRRQIEARDRGGAERIDRVLRSRARRGNGGVADGSGSGAGRFIERADSRRAGAFVHLQRRSQRRGLRYYHDLPADAGRGAALDRPAPAEALKRIAREAGAAIR